MAKVVKDAEGDEDHEPEVVVLAYTVVDPRTVVVEFLRGCYFYTPFAVVTVAGMLWLAGFAVYTHVVGTVGFVQFNQLNFFGVFGETGILAPCYYEAKC